MEDFPSQVIVCSMFTELSKITSGLHNAKSREDKLHFGEFFFRGDEKKTAKTGKELGIEQERKLILTKIRNS